MPRPPSHQPTDGELAILRLLWDGGPATLGAVCERLRAERSVATTTVATMLKVMESKGLVQRAPNPEGRGSMWAAVRGREQTAGGMLGRLIDNAFDGSARRVVTHLLEGGRLSDADREAIRALLDEAAEPPRGRKS